jgi:hypothetical protein
LDNIMRNTLLVNTILICMMFYLNKHIYDILIILIKLFLWIKLNMNLPKFLTQSTKHSLIMHINQTQGHCILCCIRSNAS